MQDPAEMCPTCGRDACPDEAHAAYYERLEERRFLRETSIAALQGILSNPRTPDDLLHTEAAAKLALRHAGALNNAIKSAIATRNQKGGPSGPG